MKNKLFKIAFILVIFILLFLNSVQADMIVPEQIFHEYAGIDKFAEYMKYTGIGVIVLAISLLSILSLTLLNRTTGKSENIKGSFILKLILNISMIYLSATSMVFFSDNELYWLFARRRFIRIIVGAIICATIVIILLIKNREKTKFLNTFTLVVTTLTILIVAFTYFNTSVGYYTYDESYRDLFNGLLK